MLQVQVSNLKNIEAKALAFPSSIGVRPDSNRGGVGERRALPKIAYHEVNYCHSLRLTNLAP
jgi:hypothetical protein